MASSTANETGIRSSELILNPDGSVYHLKLHPEQLAETVLLVGDPGRVAEVSRYFDHIEFQVSNREFITHTGSIGNKRVSCISTGIGTDNIDIVLNEVDALVNIDLDHRTPKDLHHKLQLIRIGTTGSLQEEIPVDAFVQSRWAIGLDSLLNWYAYPKNPDQMRLEQEFVAYAGFKDGLAFPYAFKAGESLADTFNHFSHQGITLTAPGFYAPQGRKLRLNPLLPDLNEHLPGFSFEKWKVANFEMETSGLYGLSSLLGHDAVTLCAVIANRPLGEYSQNPHEAVDQLIKKVLESLS